MSPDQRIKTALIALAEYYQYELTPNQVVMYAEDLRDFGYDNLIQAARAYRSDPKHTRMPLPAQLISLVKGSQSAASEAVIVANRVMTAIGRFGWPNPGAAKNYIGTWGWHVVLQHGGWNSLCQQANKSKLEILKAQLRETAKAVENQIKQGTLGQPPKLSDKSDKVKQLVNSSMKDINGNS